jgi:hypothetical protein
MVNFNLRSQHSIFHFKSFQWRFENSIKLLIEFEFEVEQLVVFSPKLEINFPVAVQNNLSKEAWDLLIFHFGLVEMISYWKATCSPIIKIHCGNLNAEQIVFWKNLFYQGLGEFRFKNNIQINKQDFVNFECKSKTKTTNITHKNILKTDSIIVPIGGGKDSVVTLEILRKNSVLPYLFLLNPRTSSLKIAEVNGVLKEKWVIAKREIDKNLLELNEKGYLNGHTPFSAMLAFMTILTAVPLGIHYIALSNENSADEGNLVFNNEIVNHQYSKSFDFEKKFTQYIQSFITDQTQYFSFLRPLKELQIARLFAKYKKYHALFKSCNIGQKKDIWCGECSKCLFVWVILSPWLSTSEMAKIFGKNIWCDLQLLETLKQLAGVVGNKPFECVGTITEVRTALAMSIKKYAGDEFPLLIEAQKWGLEIIEEGKSQEHLMPKSFMEMLQNELSS